MALSNYTPENETLGSYLDFDPEIEKDFLVDHYGKETNHVDHFSEPGDIYDLDDDKNVCSLSEQIIAHYQQQEDYSKLDENVVVDTKNILERYREVIDAETTKITSNIN